MLPGLLVLNFLHKLHLCITHVPSSNKFDFFVLCCWLWFSCEKETQWHVFFLLTNMICVSSCIYVHVCVYVCIYIYTYKYIITADIWARDVQIKKEFRFCTATKTPSVFLQGEMRIILEMPLIFKRYNNCSIIVDLLKKFAMAVFSQ